MLLNHGMKLCGLYHEYLSKFSNVRTNDIWKYASKIDPWVYSDKCNEHKNSISELEKDIKDIIKNI